MKRLEVEAVMTDEESEKLMGTYAKDTDYDVLVDNNMDVYTTEGEPLVIFRRNVLPAAVCKAAFPALRKAARLTNNRGYAAGEIPEKVEDRVGERVKKAAVMTGMRARPLKKDGTVSNTNYAQEVESGVIGYFDRNARFPYCRLTAFNMHEPEKWAAALPFIKAIDKVFAQEVPERYAKQLAMVKQTSEDFVIHGTAFTTVTVNHNWRTAFHKDAGDYKEGFGVMSVLRQGSFEGGYLVFPRYRVAVNMRTRDVCLANVHQVHGNTAMCGIKGAWHRISTVLYYRARMIHCQSAEEEMVRAATRKRGSKIND